MQSEPILGENPEIYLESSALTLSGAIRKNDRYANKRNLFEECKAILEKPYQNRIPSENNTLLRLLEKSQLLRELSEDISLDFIKGVFRNAKIEIIEERQVIAQEDQDLDYMVIVLDGKLGVQKPSFCLPSKTIESGKQKDTIDIENMKNDQLFQKLTIMGKKQRDVQRAKSKLQKKSSLPVSAYDLHLPVLTEEDYEEFRQNLQRTVSANEEYGGRERLLGRTNRYRVAALQPTTLLVIEMSFLFYWLESAFKVKLAKNIQMMKSIPCFEKIQEQKLAEIILSMKLNKKKRNEQIYHQGDEADTLFILLEGQIKLVKQAHLFKENPNDLYVDRRKLVHQLHKDDKKYHSKSLKKDEDVLPFANFTTLYNYRPIKKNIEIGVISSFGLFGEEEVVFKRPRETTAIVNCLQATFYEIQYKKILEIVGAKNADKFKSKLQHSVSKKVLYRQSEFAEHISLQNKNNLDYFYIEDGKQKQSPRKYKLDKINQKMAPKTAREDHGNAPAYYTSFNFNKLLTSRRYADGSKHDSKRKASQSSNETLQNLTLNETEQKLVGISHSWNPIESKVKQQKILVRKISPFKHEINIESPLIDQQFFRKMARQSQRINKEFRTVRLSLGKKAK